MSKRNATNIKPSIHQQNKEAQINARFVIKTDGKGYYIVNGELIPKKQFENQHPIHKVFVRNNCDRRRVWMSDIKSY